MLAPAGVGSAKPLAGPVLEARSETTQGLRLLWLGSRSQLGVRSEVGTQP